MHTKNFTAKSGFTLIELSIVLVIIGLIVGGILTGQNLINTAAIRAQIAQIEKYNIAVHAFQGKYGYLPGDIPNPYASQFSFMSRGSLAGEGDGNGVIEGNWTQAAGGNLGYCENPGETVMLWVDLSQAGLIDGGFSAASATVQQPLQVTSASNPSLSAYFPLGKIGNANYLYVYSANGMNYYGVSGVGYIGTQSITGTPALSEIQAYNIDKKTDDGYPLTGAVTASYINGGVVWAGTASSSVAVAGAGTTCYDNNNSTANQVAYTNYVNAGSGVNCALSFRFQ